MYGAKAQQIAKVAIDTWGKSAMSEKTRDKLVEAIMEIAADNKVEIGTLDLPKEFQTEEFKKLVLSLANNPLAS